ncbi:hypothetical protein CTAYLR_005764 [Chrysophaeum taylorii]|uniref:UBC core domain-containing protein n=1 Tax=Chrysophaeum taylorii TaxID=2483200 RepID=A0AAD7XP07_9STRA|nr:hypothetical protein CTAYLR_005764 [Chrysophaeum taylorii]
MAPRRRRNQRRGRPAPSEAEIAAACAKIKSDHPEFGVKRVHGELLKREPLWRISERRIQKILRANRPQLYPEDCVCLSKRREQIGWVVREDDDPPPGTCSVQWLENYDPVLEKTSNLLCLDRTLVPGDVVASRVGKLGTVTKVRVEIESKKKFVQDLEPVGTARLGDCVVHGRWIGRVSGACYDLTLSNGTKISGENVEILEDNFDELCPFFLNQKVVHRKKRRTVQKIELNQLGVSWVAWGPGTSDDNIPPPPWISPPIRVAFPVPLRVGDYSAAGPQVLRTRTSCLVRWDDDSESWDSSLNLVPRQLGEHDFLPEDLVVAEDRDEIGRVTEVYDDRTVMVKWKDETQRLSAYELSLHPLNLGPGDIVLRAAPGAGRSGEIVTTEDGELRVLAVPDDDLAQAIRLSLSEEEEEMRLGIVIRATHGKFLIEWLDGSTSTEDPENLLAVPDHSSTTTYYDDDEEEEEAVDVDVAASEEPVLPEEEDGDAAFEVVESLPSDHAFASRERRELPLSIVKRLWSQLKKIPEGIIVRAFESRSDLLRVLIWGPDGTPYEKLPFIFDLQIPAEYPEEPPSVFYHSKTSERLNPNLYENGKVCLSLLGTWTGPGWTEKSTVLQLIVSIQGLVLVEKPYFNEPGNVPSEERAEEQSLRYNENARLLSLRSAIEIIKRPPAPLKALILRHFRTSGVFDNTTASSSSSSSEGYARVLHRLIPQCKAALDEAS